VIVFTGSGGKLVLEKKLGFEKDGVE